VLVSARLPYVQFLGSARARVGVSWVDFLPDKRYGLLAYLACSDSWVARDHLASLFWSDTSTKEAKRNLRGLLQRVHALPWLTGLETAAPGLRWQVKSDVMVFHKALADGDLDEALSLYRGPFLPGMESYEDTDYAAWLEHERETLRVAWREASMRRARELTGLREFGRALTLLKQVLKGDEPDEDALVLFLRTAVDAGWCEEALQVYRDFVKRLERELGISPSLATQDLARALEERKHYLLETGQAPSTNPTAFAPNLPMVAASFIGRVAELSEIIDLFSRSDCRLLTLVGPGGVGKTRLALEVAQALVQRYQDGVYFVPLDALPAAEHIPAKLAEVLALSLQGQDDLLTQVGRFLGRRQCLLVMDNCEHVREGAVYFAELLRACPNLRILATSRERLDLEEEWLLPVQGLAVPANTLYGEEATTSEAVQLFIERARRVKPDFELTTALSAIVEVCRLVGGSPLGIELAAVWVRVLPCSDIAREIAANLDFLTSSSRTRTDRHKSLRAVFEHSWKLLSTQEQAVLRKLAVFRGGFRREAATVVAGASLRILAELADKSLLSVGPDGRYDRHPLIYGYTRKELVKHPKEEAQAEEAHGLYYLGLLREKGLDILGPRHEASLQVIGEEFENCRAAWEWALEAGRAELLLASTSLALSHYYQERVHPRDGIVFLGRSVECLSEAQPQHYAALGWLHLNQAWLSEWLGHFGEARRAASRSLVFARMAKAEGLILQALYALGFIVEEGTEAEAKQSLEEGLKLARGLIGLAAKSWWVSWYLSQLALLAACGDDALEVKQRFDAFTSLPLDVHHLTIHAVVTMGEALLHVNLLSECEALSRRGLAISRDNLYLMVNLAAAQCRQGDFTKAETQLQEALRIAQSIQNKHALTRVSLELGRLFIASGELLRAQDYLLEALRVSWSIKLLSTAPAILLELGRSLAAQGQSEQAVRLLTFVLYYPGSQWPSRRQAKRTLEALREHVSIEEMAHAKAHKLPGLTELVETILEGNGPGYSL
jgi:predicted ATPase/DNA-binding SARP family transcriptional activator